MKMSTHLVETTEEDSYIALIQFVGDLINQGKVQTQSFIADLYLSSRFFFLRNALINECSCYFYRSELH